MSGPRIPRHRRGVIPVGGGWLRSLWHAQCWLCRWPWCLLIVAAALASTLLAGCGGGDPEPEPRLPTPGVDCAARPELCL